MARAKDGTGWQVWTDHFGGYAIRNAIYPTRELAVLKLNNIVWHNRHNFRVRQAPALEPPAASPPETER